MALQMSKILILVSNELKEAARKTLSFRNFPEVFLFIDYVARLERSEIIKMGGAKNGSLSLFIPSTNGGTIAALAILLNILNGAVSIVRIPRRGFGDDIDLLLNIFQKVPKLQRRLNFISHEDLVDRAEFLRSHVNLTVAWGNNNTKPEIINLSKNIESKLLFFGSKVGLSIIDNAHVSKLNVTKQKRLVNGLTSDILTFDQSGCTNTRLRFIKGEPNQQNLEFLRSVQEAALVYRVEQSLTPQARVANLFLTEGMNRRKLRHLCLNITDRVSFLHASQIYSDLELDLDLMRSGIVFCVFFQTDQQMCHLISQVKNIGRVTYGDANIKEFIKSNRKTLKIDESQIRPIGQSNDLDYVWDAVDLIKEFKDANN